MPRNADDVLSAVKEKEERVSGGTFEPGDDSITKWDAIFTIHTEGAGYFNGRSNAMVAYAGFMKRNKYTPHVAKKHLLFWNTEYCSPPLDAILITNVIDRWGTWKDPEDEDIKTDTGDWVVLNANDLLNLEELTGGTQWLVPDVFVQGGIHFVSSASGVAKSWLLLDLSRCVTTGQKWLNRFDVKEGPVIYVDEEMGAPDVSTRVKKLRFHKESPFFYLGKQQFRIFVPEHRKRLLAMCKEQGVVLVCFDTMAGIWPGLKENDAAEVTLLRSYFKEISSLGATVVIASHDRKVGQGEDAKQNRMAGSRDFPAMADMTYGIDKMNNYYHIEYGKNRHLPDERALKLDFVIEDDEDCKHLQIKQVDRGEVASLVLSDQENKVLDSLYDNGPLNTSQVCAAVKGSPNIIGACLRSLVEKQLVTVTKDGNAKIYAGA